MHTWVKQTSFNFMGMSEYAVNYVKDLLYHEIELFFDQAVAVPHELLSLGLEDIAWWRVVRPGQVATLYKHVN